MSLYRYKRLNYGTNAAAEIFQYSLQTALQGLKGVKNIADDIIIFGATRSEHDDNLVYKDLPTTTRSVYNDLR